MGVCGVWDGGEGGVASVVVLRVLGSKWPVPQASASHRALLPQSFVDSYGTHYIKNVYYGGLASVITQMTSQSYSSIQSMNLSVSIAVQVKMVQVRGRWGGVVWRLMREGGRLWVSRGAAGGTQLLRIMPGGWFRCEPCCWPRGGRVQTPRPNHPH